MGSPTRGGGGGGGGGRERSNTGLSEISSTGDAASIATSEDTSEEEVWKEDDDEGVKMDEGGGVRRDMLAASSDWSQVRVMDCNGNSIEPPSDPNIKMKGSAAMKKKTVSKYMSAEQQAKMKAEAALVSINDIPQLCPLYMRKANMGNTQATFITDIRAIPSNSPVPLGFRLPDRCEASPIPTMHFIIYSV